MNDSVRGGVVEFFRIRCLDAEVGGSVSLEGSERVCVYVVVWSE